MEAQEYARAALDLMIREIRNSGSFPTGAACGAPVNTEGIVSASAQSFQLVYDYDGDGNCNSANENITYSYDAGGQNITRKEGTNDPQPLTVGNATNLQFAYFEQDSNVAMNPVVPADIQRVQISLTVQSTRPDTEFGGGQLTATMTSSVDLRNRGIDSGGSTTGGSTSGDSTSGSTSTSGSDSGWSGSGSSSSGDSGWSGSGSSGGW